MCVAEVESFLTISLKDVKLPKSAASDKDSILKKLSCLQEDFPQLKTEKAEIVHSNSLKELSSTSFKLPELRDKSKDSVGSQGWFYFLSLASKNMCIYAPE